MASYAEADRDDAEVHVRGQPPIHANLLVAEVPASI
jgi:hypothetical protein